MMVHSHDSDERSRAVALVLGVPIDLLDQAGAVQRIARFVERARSEGRTFLVATVNLDHLRHVLHTEDVRSRLQARDLNTADGMPVVWALRCRGWGALPRVTGSDLLVSVAAEAARLGHRLVLFGGEAGVADAAAVILRRQHAGLDVGAVTCPRLEAHDAMDPEVLDELRAARPDILAVALGHPKQERWADTFGAATGAGVVIGVGGSFDFISGRRRRAPRWAQHVGLEWFYRLLQEPRRLGPRYARDAAVLLRVLRPTGERRRARHAAPLHLPAAESGTCAVDVSGRDSIAVEDLGRLVAHVTELRATGSDVQLIGVGSLVQQQLDRLQVSAYLTAAREVSSPPDESGLPATALGAA